MLYDTTTVFLAIGSAEGNGVAAVSGTTGKVTIARSTPAETRDVKAIVKYLMMLGMERRRVGTRRLLHRSVCFPLLLVQPV